MGETLLEQLAGAVDDNRLQAALRQSVAELDGLDWGTVAGHCRRRALVDARYRAWSVYSTLAADHRGDTLARIFHRDRTTIICGLRTHGVFMYVDDAYARRYNQLLRAVVDKLLAFQPYAII